jgi:hypothetical protein
MKAVKRKFLIDLERGETLFFLKFKLSSIRIKDHQAKQKYQFFIKAT